MYRIAIQTPSTSNRPIQLQYVTDNNVVFETEDKQEALDRYELEMDNYERSKLKLVKVIDIYMNLTALEKCPICGDDCSCLGGSIEGGTTNYNLLSNKPKINNITLKDNKTAKDLKLQDEMEEYTNEEIDQLLNMQD